MTVDNMGFLEWNVRGEWRVSVANPNLPILLWRNTVLWRQCADADISVGGLLSCGWHVGSLGCVGVMVNNMRQWLSHAHTHMHGSNILQRWVCRCQLAVSIVNYHQCQFCLGERSGRRGRRRGGGVLLLSQMFAIVNLIHFRFTCACRVHGEHGVQLVGLALALVLVS